MTARRNLDDRVPELCRYIEAHADEPLTLRALSRQAGASPYHLQRRFKAIIGLTPRQYAQACRLKSLKAGLRNQRPVSDAIHDAGFGSGSRVYEAAHARMGMTPGQYRRGGKGLDISYAVSATALGTLLMAATDRGLCSVQLGDSKAELVEQLGREYPHARISPMPQRHDDQFARWMQALTRHLQDTSGRLDLPLDVRGTAFQMKVWNYLMRIPPGEVRSYAEIARAIGHPAAARAVAGACADNRVALVIPCHRVIRGDGGLGGYRWGLERKRALIDGERSDHERRRSLRAT